MSNPRNLSNFTGRLASEPKVFVNRDGSRKVSLNVYVDRAYTNSKGERPSDALQMEQLVGANVNYDSTPFALMHTGDLIQASAHLEMDKYKKTFKTARFVEGPHAGKVIMDGNNKPLKVAVEVYENVIVVDSATLLESKATTQTRLAERATKTAGQKQSVQAAAPAVAPVAAVQTQPAQATTLGFNESVPAPAPAVAAAQPVQAAAYSEPAPFGN